MIDMEKLGRNFRSARFSLDVAMNNLVADDRLPEEEVQDHADMLDMAIDQVKAICDTLAKASGDFCKGYVAANREAIEAGRQWSEARAEKIALLRLAGDETPEEQIPV